MTNNEHWIFLENLRRSGIVNMYGAAPYLQEVFEMSKREAKAVLLDWMKNYKKEDYDGI